MNCTHELQMTNTICYSNIVNFTEGDQPVKLDNCFDFTKFSILRKVDNIEKIYKFGQTIG